MAVTLKIKRRASGNAGAPTTLKSGELAFNEVSTDKLLYYGYGDDGSGNATSVVAIGGQNIPNTGLANSSATLNSKSLTLGGSLTLDTDDIGEGSSNLYYTDARSRASVSVTDAGGDGSLAYNNSTGVITYTGPSAAQARAHLSATTATGVTYTSGTGVIALASIPNSSLTNSTFTVTDGTDTFTRALGEALTFSGTTNETDVSTSTTGTVKVGLPSDVTIGNDLTVTTDLAVGGDAVITGDLTVNGALVSLSTTEVKVEDKNILLGDTSSPTDITADGGGITLKGAADYSIVWVNSTNSWTFNQNVNVTTGGFSIGGTAIINSSRVVSNLAITGSGNTVDNVTLDGGTF